MAGTDKRSSMVQVAIVLSMINLMILVAGILWVSNAFQAAERDDQDVVETLKVRAKHLSGAVQSLGGIVVLGACVFVAGGLIVSYLKATRRAAQHRQSAELNSYLKNLSRARRDR